MANNNLEFEIVKYIGEIKYEAEGKNETGIIKKVCIIKWGGNKPKLDIRNWTPDGKPLKGVVIDLDGVDSLINLLYKVKE